MNSSAVRSVLHPAGYSRPVDEPEPAQRDQPGLPDDRRPRHDGGRPAAAHVGRHTLLALLIQLLFLASFAYLKPLKVMSNEKKGGSFLASIDRFYFGLNSRNLSSFI